MPAPGLVVLDVHETLWDLEPLRQRSADVGAGAPAGHLVRRRPADGSALAASGGSRTFPEVGAAVLTGLLSALDGLARPLPAAVAQVLEGVGELDVHHDVPGGVRALAEGGLRVVTPTTGSLTQTEGLLERVGVADLVERRLSVDDAGRWWRHDDRARRPTRNAVARRLHCAGRHQPMSAA